MIYTTVLNEGFVVDTYLLWQFLKRLTTPFEKTKAFELGLIDKDGTVLKHRKDFKTQEEKDAMGAFDVLLFNIKKLIEKVPFGKSQLATYAAALWLLKEGKNLPDLAEYRFQTFLEDAMVNKEKDFNSLIEEIANSVGAGAIAGVGTDAEVNGPPVKKKKKEEEEVEPKAGRKLLGFKEFAEKIQEATNLPVPTQGTILSCIWGWSMTICDFYYVVAVSGTMLTLQKLHKVAVNKNEAFAPKVIPNGKIPDVSVPPLRKKWNGREVKIGDSQFASPWNGQPVTENHLD